MPGAPGARDPIEDAPALRADDFHVNRAETPERFACYSVYTVTQTHADDDNHFGSD